MSHLAITLFGGFQAELDDHPLAAFSTDKDRALLAYLALESEHPHRRESLAALLWPDHPEVVARISLRQALFHLRRLLMQTPGTEPYLLVTFKQVQFNTASDCWIDVVEFKRLLSTCRPHHPASLGLCAVCVENLQRAVELYQGDLLAGFTLPRCTEFTDWQTFTQEDCHIQAMEALTMLADYYETNSAFDALIACTQNKIKLEPWRESAHRRRMWAMAMKGEREGAMREYETLREVLKRELGVAPMEKTRRLYEQIRNSLLHTRKLHKVRSRSLPH